MIAEDYLKFVKNLKYYLNQELIFISSEDANHAEELRKKVSKFGNYPIGRLGDINIHFLHSKTEEEARDTWIRRCKRVNYSHIIIKFSTQNLCTEKDCIEFDDFNFPNKIFFTSHNINGIRKQIIFKRDIGREETRAEGNYYHRYINITKYINSIQNTQKYFL